MPRYSFHCFIVFLICLPLTFYAQIATSKATVKVSGEVTKPLLLTREDLSKMTRTTATLKDHDGKNVPYSGVAVQQILELAGVTIGNQLRGKNLAKYLLVKSSDGYEVVFSLAELDKGFNDKLVILADKTNGSDLPVDKGSFRIIVQGEKVPARSSFQVTELIVKFAKD